MATGGATDRQLNLRVDASIELARRNLNALEAQVDRNSRKMEADLGRIEAAAIRSGASFGKLAGVIGGFFTGIGIMGLSAVGKGILDFADDIGTAADQAGIGVERFQTLKEGLRALEVDSDQADAAFKRLTDTLGAVQSGSAAQGVVDVLDRMGIRTKILSGEISTADQLLDAIAASSTRFKSEAEFTAAVVDLLGRKVGVDMAAALRDGGVALHGLEEKMRTTGGVISSEMIDRLAEANETIDSFQTRASRQFAIMAANAITSLDGVQLKLLQLARSASQFNPLGPATADYDAAINEIRGRQDGSKDFLRGKRDKVARAHAAFLDAQGGALPGAAQKAKELREAIDELRVATVRYRAATGTRVGDLNAVPAPARVTFDPPEEGGSGGRSGRSGASAKSLADRLQDQLDGSMRDQLSDVLAKYDEPIEVNLDYVDQLNEYRDERERIEEELYRKGEDQIRNVADLYEDALTGGTERIWDNFKQLGMRVIADLLARMSTNNGGQGGSFGDMLGSSLGAVFGGFFAEGGDPPVGIPSVVGEKGPELFIPRVAGTIIPNHLLGGGETRVTVVPSPYFDTRVQQVSAPAAGRAMLGGAALAQQRAARAQRQKLGRNW
jgi:hypothetical protein